MKCFIDNFISFKFSMQRYKLKFEYNKYFLKKILKKYLEY